MHWFVTIIKKIIKLLVSICFECIKIKKKNFNICHLFIIFLNKFTKTIVPVDIFNIFFLMLNFLSISNKIRDNFSKKSKFFSINTFPLEISFYFLGDFNWLNYSLLFF
jgi:hypothetical protein